MKDKQKELLQLSFSLYYKTIMMFSSNFPIHSLNPIQTLVSHSEPMHVLIQKAHRIFYSQYCLTDEDICWIFGLNVSGCFPQFFFCGVLLRAFQKYRELQLFTKAVLLLVLFVRKASIHALQVVFCNNFTSAYFHSTNYIIWLNYKTRKGHISHNQWIIHAYLVYGYEVNVDPGAT